MMRSTIFSIGYINLGWVLCTGFEIDVCGEGTLEVTRTWKIRERLNRLEKPPHLIFCSTESNHATRPLYVVIERLRDTTAMIGQFEVAASST